MLLETWQPLRVHRGGTYAAAEAMLAALGFVVVVAAA